MRRFFCGVVLTSITLVAASALAQPRASRPKGPPPPVQQTHGTPPGRGVAAPPMANFQMCNSRRAVLTQEQRRLGDSQANMARVDAELAQLKRRIGELSQERNAIVRDVANYTQRVKTVQREYDSQCAKDDTCDQYESLAGNLNTQASSVERDMNMVQTDIASGQTEMNQLTRDIEPLRSEYRTLACNNMVPGATEQTTIDRCAVIFSDWNRLQARLNDTNNRLSMLKSRYEQLYAQMRNIETRANGYDAYMSRNCASSPQVATMRGYAGVRQRAEKMGKDLDDLINSVSKLRGIQITVSPK